MKTLVRLSAILAVFLLASCAESVEEQAARSLQSAREAFERGNYQDAKSELDSLKTLYPKAFDARREALKLMREVELAEQQQNRLCLDSLIAAKQAELQTMLKSGFTFEKDEKYQEIGNFMAASQAPMKNLDNTYLRGQVDENGVMTVTSIYKGNPISHDKVKVSSGDNYAESANPISKYSSKHLGVTTERVDFRFGKDEGIIGFIVLNADKNIKVELIGEKKSHSYKMRKEDIKAIKSLYELSVVLRTIKELEASRQEAERHIEFVKRNQQRDQQQNTAE